MKKKIVGIILILTLTLSFTVIAKASIGGIGSGHDPLSGIVVSIDGNIEQATQ